MGEPLTTGEAGRILEVSADRVRQLVDEGQLEAVRTPTGLRLLERGAVEALAARRAARRATDETAA
jgi:excisionase family DNA binding protein